MEDVFYSDAAQLLRIIISVPIIYFLVIIYIRIMGVRTSSQMNSFDWIVTVSMGSIVGSTVVLETVPLAAGALAILALMGLQYLLTNGMISSKTLRKIVRAKPKLLFLDGKFLTHMLHQERIMEAEIYSAIREKGIQDIHQVYAVVLETDARMSVIEKKENSKYEILSGVEGTLITG